MTQGITDRYWQAEVRSQETKQLIRDIKRITRRKFTAEEKIRIVLEGFRRDTPIRDLCRREGIRPSTYYAWLKDFMEAGKDRLKRYHQGRYQGGDTGNQA
jgi:transposase-like protein